MKQVYRCLSRSFHSDQPRRLGNKRREGRKKSTDSIEINTHATDVSHLHVSADGMDAAQPPVSTDNMDATATELQQSLDSPNEDFNCENEQQENTRTTVSLDEESVDLSLPASYQVGIDEQDDRLLRRKRRAGEHIVQSKDESNTEVHVPVPNKSTSSTERQECLSPREQNFYCADEETEKEDTFVQTAKEDSREQLKKEDICEQLEKEDTSEHLDPLGKEVMHVDEKGTCHLKEGPFDKSDLDGKEMLHVDEQGKCHWIPVSALTNLRQVYQSTSDSLDELEGQEEVEGSQNQQNNLLQWEDKEPTLLDYVRSDLQKPKVRIPMYTPPVILDTPVASRNFLDLVVQSMPTMEA